VLFRNYNQTLIDNASSEYFFLTDFLGINKSHDITAVFSFIFEPTLSVSSAFTKHIAAATSDIFAVLLCIRLTQHYAFTLQKRRMPALDGYINSTGMLLWPRFQVLMDQHAESLRRFGVPAGRKGDELLSAHGITQRFAGLLQGLLILSEERDDEPLVNSLGRVRSDFEAFLTKWSSSIGDGKKRERFLYNNYSLVSTVLSVFHLKPPLIAERRWQGSGTREAAFQ
jgi:vacuolar protein sorting-associated protein 52